MPLMRFLFVVIVVIGISAIASGGGKAAPAWGQIGDGLSYVTFTVDDGGPATTLHAFRIDPAKYRIDVATAKNEREGSSVREMARRTKALLAINGSFFTPEHTTIGLIVKDGHELSPLHNTSWWSIFAMTGTSAAIFSPKDFPSAKNVRMALQAGPRLAVKGKIPKLKESVAARSAVGITPSGQVIIAITQGPGISMTELARRMSMDPAQGGLGCPNAMAFDGGSSSQLYAKVKKFELDLPNIARVTNGLVVLSK